MTCRNCSASPADAEVEARLRRTRVRGFSSVPARLAFRRTHPDIPGGMRAISRPTLFELTKADRGADASFGQRQQPALGASCVVRVELGGASRARKSGRPGRPHLPPPARRQFAASRSDRSAGLVALRAGCRWRHRGHFRGVANPDSKILPFLLFHDGQADLLELRVEQIGFGGRRLHPWS